jgi:predicted transport protein
LLVQVTSSIVPGRHERVPVDQYTIEHIMPQNENLSASRKADLGAEWERIHQTWLHTLGNLTLTGYNSEYSDRPFIEKRDMEGGFSMSPLKLNRGLGQVSQWDEDAIKERADRLANLALEVWVAPQLTSDVLNLYRPRAATPGYTIDNHPNLLVSPTRELFEAFRREVLALDPCVTEEFLKLHVAYKAETNFVDIIPRSGWLRLSLNLAFPEITDPKGICEDVTGMGRWGNGDVHVRLGSLDELHNVMGLVRQSFERQMENESEP